MLIYVKKKKKKKTFYGRTDGQTDGQPKTIVRNLTIFYFTFISTQFSHSLYIISNLSYLLLNLFSYFFRLH